MALCTFSSTPENAAVSPPPCFSFPEPVGREKQIEFVASENRTSTPVTISFRAFRFAIFEPLSRTQCFVKVLDIWIEENVAGFTFDFI